jgi:hypothetical protein
MYIFINTYIKLHTYNYIRAYKHKCIEIPPSKAGKGREFKTARLILRDAMKPIYVYTYVHIYESTYLYVFV